MRVLMLMLALGLAICFGLMVAYDPGYAAFHYGATWVLMPLWLFLVGLIIGFFILYFLIRFIIVLFGSHKKLKFWLERKRGYRAHRNMCRGLIELTEGHWRDAQKYLIKEVEYSETPLINYLAAARATHALEEYAVRDDYVRLAYQCAPDAKIAIGLSQAHMQLEQNQLEQGLATLLHLRGLSPNHRYILGRLKRVYEKINDWASLYDLLDALKRQKLVNSVEVLQIEHKYFIRQLQGSVDYPTLQKNFENIPKVMRRKIDLVIAYVTKLLEFKVDDVAAPNLEDALRLNYNQELLGLYSKLVMNINDQFIFIESLLKTVMHNAELYMLAGDLAVKNELYGKGLNYFTSSLKLDNNPRILARLINLYRLMGQLDEAIKLQDELIVMCL